ncbi:MAG: ATP-grasp domain-containing protein, partial [Chloroflexi bacterium]|nr:ATP-grasp domain-containing protein [Chloroflexota bacterium]
MTKRLILLASANSYRKQDFLDAAKRLDIEVVLGMDVPAPMMDDLKCDLPLDYLNIEKSSEKIAAFAAKAKVDAILSADDSATVLAAQASQSLNLRHNSADAAEAARDKFLMRQLFARAEILSPNFLRFPLSQDPEEIADLIPYPCVIKPRSMSGSRGVIRADSPIDFMKAYSRLKPILQQGGADDFLAEDYIDGVEVALEGIMNNGEFKVLALFDKPDPLVGPYFEETIYTTPSRLPHHVQQNIFATTAKAASALGLREGPIHAELRINDQGAWLVEVAARSIGGLCSRTLQFGTDMSLEELILRQTFGMEITQTSEVSETSEVLKAGGVMMIPIPHGGILRCVYGVEEAQAVPL